MSRPVCPVCDERSSEVAFCSNCGKPFDGSETSDNDRAALGGDSR